MFEQTLSTQGPPTDAEAEWVERCRLGRHGADATCVVGMPQARREKRRFWETANRSVLCDDPSLAQRIAQLIHSPGRIEKAEERTVLRNILVEELLT